MVNYLTNQTVITIQNTQDNTKSFNQLPVEILMEILHKLPPLELWNIRQTCTQMKILTDNEHFTTLYNEKLGIINDPPPHLPLPFSTLMHKLTKTINYLCTSSHLAPKNKSKKLKKSLTKLYKSNLIPYLTITRQTTNLPKLKDQKKSTLKKIFPVLENSKSLIQTALREINASNFYLAYFLGESIQGQQLYQLINNIQLNYESVDIKELDKILELMFKNLNVNEPYSGTLFLTQASEQGALDIVKKLITNKADVNLKNSDGDTPLHAASQEGHLDIAKVLIEAGADVNLKNNIGDTPLYKACENGHLDTVKFLIEAGADINLASNDGNTPLHAASQNGHLDTVKFLIEARADVNLKNNIGDTPLYKSCENGHLDTVEELINAGANVNLATKNKLTPLHSASIKNNLNLVKILIRNGANVNSKTDSGITPLLAISTEESLDVIKELIDAGADVNLASNVGITPLTLASYEGNHDVVKVLVNAGATGNFLFPNSTSQCRKRTNYP